MLKVEVVRRNLREPINSPCRLESRFNRYGVLDTVHCCNLIGMNIKGLWLEAFSQMKTSFAMYSFIYNFLYSLGPMQDECVPRPSHNPFRGTVAFCFV